jgi:hypothetical protein
VNRECTSDSRERKCAPLTLFHSTLPHPPQNCTWIRSLLAMFGGAMQSMQRAAKEHVCGLPGCVDSCGLFQTVTFLYCNRSSRISPKTERR